MASEIDTILLLTGYDEAPLLGEILRRHHAGLEIIPLHDRAGAAAACATAGQRTRLLSVCSPVIVPGEALRSLPGPAYNFHPGPPTRPGRYPSVFAVYHDDKRFGVTVHEMAARVDSGAIVAVDWFEMTPDCDLLTLENTTLRRLIAQFQKLAPHMATKVAPLPHSGDSWTGPKTTLAQVTALSRITPELSQGEVQRRRRAVGGQVIEDKDPGWIAT